MYSVSSSKNSDKTYSPEKDWLTFLFQLKYLIVILI